MRTDRGFTLVELVVVISIIVILTTIATLSWNRMSMKAAVEGQIKTIHADMMRIRLEALYAKQERLVKVEGSTFKIYPSNVDTDEPLEVKSFKYPFNATKVIIFNTSGLASGYEGSVCVTPSVANDSYVDSLVVTDGRISLGKKTTGEACVSDKITKR